MGEVWRAIDTSHDNRPVAVKLLGAWLGGDEDFARRFRRECALAARVAGPHVIPIHRYGEIDGRLFIDMPLIDGVDLSDLLAEHGALPLERAVGIIEQVADALNTAHAADLVHRDVKPSNILVTARDFTYLIDFGISRAVDGTRISLSGAVLGTPAYMAPERFDGAGDHRSDIYALGCVLYETLTGRKPFEASSLPVYMKAHLSTPPPRPSSLRAGLPVSVDEVVLRALAKDPAERFVSAAAFGVELRRALDVPASPSVSQAAVLGDTSPNEDHPTRPAEQPPPALEAAASTLLNSVRRPRKDQPAVEETAEVRRFSWPLPRLADTLAAMCVGLVYLPLSPLWLIPVAAVMGLRRLLGSGCPTLLSVLLLGNAAAIPLGRLAGIAALGTAVTGWDSVDLISLPVAVLALSAAAVALLCIGVVFRFARRYREAAWFAVAADAVAAAVPAADFALRATILWIFVAAVVLTLRLLVRPRRPIAIAALAAPAVALGSQEGFEAAALYSLPDTTPATVLTAVNLVFEATALLAAAAAVATLLIALARQHYSSAAA